MRGSGLKGLTSFDEKTKINNVNILRPLLNQKKDDMLFVSNFVFNFFVKDPSNDDEKFQRIRVRKLISELKKEMKKMLYDKKYLDANSGLWNACAGFDHPHNRYGSNIARACARNCAEIG